MKRKYADGGLVVSRGYDAGLGNIRLMDMPDVSLAPSAAMAADRMASDDTVAARPSMKELQDANLKAVRSSDAAPVRRRRAAAAAPASVAKTKKDDMSDAEIRAFMRENDRAADASVRKPATRQGPRVGIQNLGDKIPAVGRYLKTVGQERSAARAANQAKVEQYLRQGRPGMARMYAAIAEGADLDAAKRKLNMKNGGSVKKADAMKKMPAKAMPKKAMPMAMKKAMPMAAMMAKKPAKKAK